ncbi:hypothetical protein GCM10017779_69310 [Streptomyces capillispiralis]|nr:hypothetical protein GCM10017779_69310 [Streptomyces capillispiralis]
MPRGGRRSGGGDRLLPGRGALPAHGRHLPGAGGPAAGFHGGGLATDAPDGPHLLAGRITAEVYFGHADRDHALPAEQIERLERALTEAGVRHRCEVYAGAGHGCTQSDTAAYDEAADERHWAALLGLLRRAF